MGTTINNLPFEYATNTSSVSSIAGPSIILKLKKRIDNFSILAKEIKGLILEYARWLDENRQCRHAEICRKIKNELKDEINQGKISVKWIEECLPREYKRRYTKCQVISNSSSGNLVTIVDGQVGSTLKREDPINNSQEAIAVSQNGVNSISNDDIENLRYELIQAVENLLFNDSIEDKLNKLSQEYESLIGVISSSKKEFQKKMYLACRNFLEQIIEVVNHKLAEL